MQKPKLNTIRYIGITAGAIAVTFLLISPFAPTIMLAGFFTLLMMVAAIAQMYFYPNSLP